MFPREKRIFSLRELWSLIREDYATNDRSFFRPGFQALAIYRFGVWKNGLENPLLRVPCTILYRLLFFLASNVYGIELPIYTRIGRRLFIAHQHGIVLHPTAVIGDDCVIRQGVTLGQKHHTPGRRPPPTPRLGNRVHVGVNAVLLGDIAIGDDVVIGANAVVTTDVPAGSIVTVGPMNVRLRSSYAPEPSQDFTPGMPTPDTGPLPLEIERARRQGHRRRTKDPAPLSSGAVPSFPGETPPPLQRRG